MAYQPLHPKRWTDLKREAHPMTAESARPHIGVVLMTYGSPATLDDVPGYLRNVYGGREPSDEVITEFKRRYDLIGGSPLLRVTQEQAAALEAELNRRHPDGPTFAVTAGMRFFPPFIADVTPQVAEGAEVLDALLVQLARSVEVAAEEREIAEVHERLRDPMGRADGARVVERGVEARASGVEVALLAGEDARHVEGIRAQLGRLVRCERERRLQRLASLGEVAVDLPEAADSRHQP